MTIYAETSVVLRWLFNEDASEQILADLQKAKKVVCSRLTLLETRRVIRRAAAESRISEAEAVDLFTVFGQAAARWAVVGLSSEVARRAEGIFPVEPVRTLDAIHLASALFRRESLPDLLLLSTDERVRRIAVPELSGAWYIPATPSVLKTTARLFSSTAQTRTIGYCRRCATSRKRPGKSDMIPSTPRSSSRSISWGSLIVHTCISRPSVWAAATVSAVTKGRS